MATAAPTSPSTAPIPVGPHQDRAIDTIMDEESLLIEYGTGTGKTRIYVEAVEALVYTGDIPILILVPNSLIEQTVEEFWKWASPAWVDRHVQVLAGGMNVEDRHQHLKHGRANVYIMSHESMSYPIVRSGLNARRWAAVFLDEASRFRNHSKRTQTLTTLGRRAKSRYAFTGNLAPRSPMDVWYVMNWLEPGLFSMTDRKTFMFEYCLLGGFGGTQAVGIRPDRLSRFREIMDKKRITCELRDLRAMPPRVLHVSRVNLDSTARKAYIQMQEELKLEIERVDDETFKSHVKTYATRLQRLQEICAGFARNIEGDVVSLPCSKSSAMLDLLEDEPDMPTIIWYWWRPEYEGITRILRKAKIPFTWFGDPGAVSAFMEGHVNVFVSQLAKGGYGLNLTRATRMIYHSQPWDLDAYMQSQERNMRLTTTADRLEIVHLVTRHSVDEYVRQRLVEKAGVSMQLTRSQALEMLKGAP
jgi:SNF2 family DNA or RNA helicase